MVVSNGVNLIKKTENPDLDFLLINIIIYIPKRLCIAGKTAVHGSQCLIIAFSIIFLFIIIF